MKAQLLITACVILSGCGASVDRSTQDFRASNARARMAEYVQAQQRGDLLDMCVKSNVVSAAYQDAGDIANAQAWKLKNAEDCRAAYAALAPSRAVQPGE